MLEMMLIIHEDRLFQDAAAPLPHFALWGVAAGGGELATKRLQWERTSVVHNLLIQRFEKRWEWEPPGEQEETGTYTCRQ